MSKQTRLHPKLTECRMCKSFKYTCTKHSSYPHCTIIRCCSCGIQWFVCEQHNKRFNVQNLHKLHSHFVSEHSLIDMSLQYCDAISNDVVSLNDEFNTQYSDDEDQHNIHIHKRTKTDTITLQTVQNQNPEMNIEKQIQQIVGTAFSNNRYSTATVNTDEVAFHLNMTNFCTNITESQQVQLIDIIYKLMSTKFESTRPPTTHQDLQKFYLTGQHSIYKNIPCPVVSSFDNHACVSIQESIKYALRSLCNISIIPTSQYDKMTMDHSDLTKTPKACHILQSIHKQYESSNIDPYVLFVTFWSDDFEVNHTRKNRNSTWIKTMSIVGSKQTQTSPYHTQLIAIGHKGDNHNNINAHINKELLELRNHHYYYVNQTQSTLPIVVYPLAVLADRPERCTLNATLSFSGNSTRRWLYSSLVNPHKLASCKSCYQARIRKYFNLGASVSKRKATCSKCCDFDYHTSSIAKLFHPPTNYPRSKHVKSPPFPIGRDVVSSLNNNTLEPIKISYEVLTCGAQAACFNLLTKHWNVSETRAYLKTLGVSTSFSNTLIEHSTKNINQVTAPILQMQSLSLPDVWIDGLFDIDQFIETPMHHLFEGIMKALIEVTMDFLKFYKLWSRYCEHINPILEELNNLKLDYCHIEPFWHTNSDYKPTGWIAENYLAYARLSVVLLVHMEPFIDHNHLGFVEFKSMIHTAFVLLSHLMSRSCVNPYEIEELIKIFLSTCHNFDVTFGYSHDNTPFWYKKSNFVSLLNIPTQIKLFGPVYLYWEGTKERYIQYVKPMLKNKRKTTSYLCTKFQQILQNNAVHLYNSQFQTSILKKSNRYKDVYVFSSEQSLKDNIENHENIPIIIKCSSPIMYLVLHKQNSMITYKTISFNDGDGYHKCGLWFAPIKIVDFRIPQYNSTDEILNDNDQCAILVHDSSKKTNESQITTRYTVLSSTWDVRIQDGQMKLPKISRELINAHN